jgi:hypothetical protein
MICTNAVARPELVRPRRGLVGDSKRSASVSD